MSIKDIGHLKLLNEAKEFNKYFFDKNNNDRGSKAGFNAKLKELRNQHEEDMKKRDDELKQMRIEAVKAARIFGTAEEVILTGSKGDVARMTVTRPIVDKQATAAPVDATKVVTTPI